MHLQRLREERAFSVRAVLVVTAFFFVGCGEIAEVGSPVSLNTSPLAERLEKRADEDPEINLGATTAEAIAFADASLSGSSVRFHIDTGPSGTGLFAGPGRGYQEVDRLAAGSIVIATGTQTGEWAFIQFGNSEGWVNNRRLSINEIAEQDIFVAPEIVNVPVTLYETRGSTDVLRNAEDDSSISFSVDGGEELVGTGATVGNWIEVRYEGQSGWVSGNELIRTATRVLNETGIYETTPITSAPSTTTRRTTTRTPTTRAPTRTVTTSAPRVRSSTPAATSPPRRAAPATTAAPAAEQGTGGGIGNANNADEGNNAGGGNDGGGNNAGGGTDGGGNNAGGGNDGGSNNADAGAGNNAGGGGGGNATEPDSAPAAEAPAPTTAAPAPPPTTAAPAPPPTTAAPAPPPTTAAPAPPPTTAAPAPAGDG